MHVHGHEDVTTRKRSAQDQKLWAASTLEVHTTHNTVGGPPNRPSRPAQGPYWVQKGQVLWHIY